MPAGRPKKPIDWEKVKDLCMAGCSGPEIAPHFDIHPETFYDRCVIDQGVKFTDFAGEHRQKGISLLRAAQFAKALGHSDKGDNTLLIWLGKQRLGQTDKKKEDENQDDILTKIAQIIKELDKVSGPDEVSRLEETGRSEVAYLPPILD